MSISRKPYFERLRFWYGVFRSEGGSVVFSILMAFNHARGLRDGWRTDFFARLADFLRVQSLTERDVDDARREINRVFAIRAVHGIE